MARAAAPYAAELFALLAARAFAAVRGASVRLSPVVLLAERVAAPSSSLTLAPALEALLLASRLRLRDELLAALDEPWPLASPTWIVDVGAVSSGAFEPLVALERLERLGVPAALAEWQQGRGLRAPRAASDWSPGTGTPSAASPRRVDVGNTPTARALETYAESPLVPPLGQEPKRDAAAPRSAAPPPPLTPEPERPQRAESPTQRSAVARAESEASPRAQERSVWLTETKDEVSASDGAVREAEPARYPGSPRSPLVAARWESVAARRRRVAAGWSRLQHSRQELAALAADVEALAEVAAAAVAGSAGPVGLRAELEALRARRASLERELRATDDRG